MVEIPCIGGPGPAAHFRAGFRSNILERGTARILVQRIAPGVAAIDGSDFGWLIGMKVCFLGDSLAGGGPHIGNVNLLMAVVVDIGPAGAHAGPGLVDSGGFGNGFKSAVAAIAVKIATAKIVGHVQVWPAVRIDITPSASKAEAIVFGVET